MAEINHSHHEDSDEEEGNSSIQVLIGTLPDRLSALPDSLILHILRLLDSTKQSVRTSTLSKRWKHLWTSVDTLSFIYDHNTAAAIDFVALVSDTLAQCNRNLKLNKLKIHLYYENCFVNNVTFWVLHALYRNVKDLEIDLGSGYGGREFVMSERLFINTDLTKLKLISCSLERKERIHWKMLSSLHLSWLKVNEDLIENILLGSPVLELLELCSCYGCSRLDISSTCVKKLVLDCYFAVDNKLDKILEINAPNILSLDIKGTFRLQKMLLLDVSSVVEANLDYTISSSKETQEEMLRGFIRGLQHAKELTVGDSCVEVLSCLQAKGFSFPSSMKFPVVTSP